LHQHHNYQKECAYLFYKYIQKNGVDHVISEMCIFLHHEISNVQGRFFDKNSTLAEFSHLCNYERFGLITVISIDILGNNVTIDDCCCEYHIFDRCCE
jgi:hypothetical protein